MIGPITFKVSADFLSLRSWITTHLLTRPNVRSLNVSKDLALSTQDSLEDKSSGLLVKKWKCAYLHYNKVQNSTLLANDQLKTQGEDKFAHNNCPNSLNRKCNPRWKLCILSLKYVQNKYRPSTARLKRTNFRSLRSAKDWTTELYPYIVKYIFATGFPGTNAPPNI
jgi:hypothetical protein